MKIPTVISYADRVLAELRQPKHLAEVMFLKSLVNNSRAERVAPGGQAKTLNDVKIAFEVKELAFGCILPIALVLEIIC